MQEVSVPGFNKGVPVAPMFVDSGRILCWRIVSLPPNTRGMLVAAAAITKVALTKDASGTVPTAVAMAKQKRSEPDKRDAVWVDRALFPSRFGKQRKT